MCVERFPARVAPFFVRRSCCVAASLCAGLAPAASAAGPALALPTFQELLTPPAPPASAPAAASTPAVDDADMVRSLDNIISTLDSDKQRTALVAQLKKLRDAKREAEAAQAASAGASSTAPAPAAPRARARRPRR